MNEYLEDFEHAARAPEKLRAAICFWLCADRTEAAIQRCEKYLRSRIRPAVQALIRCEETAAIDILAAAGLFGERETAGFLQDALQEKKTRVIMYLLHLQKCQRQGGKSLFPAADTASVYAGNSKMSTLYRKLTAVLELTGSTPALQNDACEGAGTGSAPDRGHGDGQGTRGDTAGTGSEFFLSEDIRRTFEAHERFDYHRVLSRFMEPAEVMEQDPDGFDCISYMAGLSLPDRLMLTEPLEYREVNRLQELVIAIDTSASCSTETVRQFLAETWSVLTDTENFSAQMVVYLIQCDVVIQRVDILRSRDDWMRTIRGITIEGRSGTSFRPVFQYIKKEQAQGRLKKLRAVLYFTDGDGIYPDEKPAYETFFVFLQHTKFLRLVPPWAHALVIGDMG